MPGLSNIRKLKTVRFKTENLCEMSPIQKEGIIICIPKGDKPREYLKNWRPISLLNVVYKIAI